MKFEVKEEIFKVKTILKTMAFTSEMMKNL